MQRYAVIFICSVLSKSPLKPFNLFAFLFQKHKAAALLRPDEKAVFFLYSFKLLPKGLCQRKQEQDI